MNDLFECVVRGAGIAVVAILPLPLAAQEIVVPQAPGVPIPAGGWGAGHAWPHHRPGPPPGTVHPFWDGVVPLTDFGAAGAMARPSFGGPVDFNGGIVPDPGFAVGAGNGNGNGNIGSNNGNGNLTNGNGNFGIGDGVGNGGRAGPN